MNRLALALTATAVFAPVVHAQEIKLTMPSGSNYCIVQKPGSVPHRKKDQITVRIIVTQHVLRPPDCYKTLATKTIVENKVAPEPNKLPNPMPEDTAKRLRDVLRHAALDDSVNVIDTLVLHAMGDVVYNYAELKRLCEVGKNQISTEDRDHELNKAAKYLFLIGPDGKRDVLTMQRFQDLGRWSIDEYTVQAPELLTVRKLYGVRIEWEMEAVIDLKNPQPFPVINSLKPQDIPTPTDTGQVAPEKTEGSVPGGLSFESLGLGPATGLANPGVDPVIGWAASEQSDGLIAGLNLRLKGGRRLGEYSPMDRVGVFLGRTQSSASNPSFTVLAPSYMMGPNSILFFGWRIGGSFRNNGQGRTRQGLAIGAAVRFGVSGVTEQHKDEDGLEIKNLRITGAEAPPAFACSKDSLTAVVFNKTQPYLDLDPKGNIRRRDGSPKSEYTRWVLWLNREKIDEMAQTLEPDEKIEKWNGKTFKVLDNLKDFVYEAGAIYRVTLKPTKG